MNYTKTKLGGAVLAIAMLGLVGQAQAAIIFTPDSAWSATGALSSSRSITEAIDSSGLSGGGTSGDILSETHAVNDGNDDYWIGDLSGAALEFDLAGPSTVDTVHLWTYSRTGQTDRGMQSFTISFWVDGGTEFANGINITDVDEGNYPNPIAVQSFGFASQSNVTKIRIDNIVNHGDGSYVGLSEIRFGNSIPEPASLALVGLGSLLIAGRRRQRA